ncbi:MAG: RecX family transcriptional regulator, partial [Alphaproteobacteria bacterium]
EAWAAADRFARRKRVGPYATAPLDPKQCEKAIAAFLRAGHDYAVARRWVDAAPGEALAQEEE